MLREESIQLKKSQENINIMLHYYINGVKDVLERQGKNSELEVNMAKELQEVVDALWEVTFDEEQGKIQYARKDIYVSASLEDKEKLAFVMGCYITDIFKAINNLTFQGIRLQKEIMQHLDRYTGTIWDMFMK